MRGRRWAQFPPRAVPRRTDPLALARARTVQYICAFCRRCFTHPPAWASHRNSCREDKLATAKVGGSDSVAWAGPRPLRLPGFSSGVHRGIALTLGGHHGCAAAGAEREDTGVEGQAAGKDVPPPLLTLSGRCCLTCLPTGAQIQCVAPVHCPNVLADR